MLKKIIFIFFLLISGLLFSQEIKTNLPFSVDEYKLASKAIITSFIFQGSFLVMGLYMFLLFIQNRKKDYLYYSIYLTSFTLYFFFRSHSVFNPNLFDNNQINLYLMTPLLLIITAIYVKFINSFAEIKNYNKAFANRLNIFSYSLYIIAGIIITYTIITKDFQTVKKYQFWIILPMHLYTLLALIRAFIVIKSNLRYYVLFANIFLFGFAMIGFYVAKLNHLPEDINSHNLFGFYTFNATQFGTFLEMICFSLGLGYKFSLIEKEKNVVKEKYIKQLIENETVTKQLNEELTNLVTERTKEIEIKSELFRKEQEAKIKSEFNEKLIKSELTSLRARINPHFIFNSLNSIKSFIISNDVKKSVSYFSKFAKLLRYSLNNSSTDFVNLIDEIIFLKDYVALERLRITNQFEFAVEYDTDLDVDKIQIPPLIIQPFIENAIRHGLSLKKDNGLLQLQIISVNNFLEIHIIDNGIGRKASSLINKGKTYTSKGISITTERLEIFSKIYKLEKSFEIIDLLDHNNIATGTKVIIKLPLLYENG